MYSFNQSLKCFDYSFSTFRANFYPIRSKPLSTGLSLLWGYFSLCLQVRLCPNYYYWAAFRSWIFYLTKPFSYIFKGVVICYGIDKKYSICVFVVSWSESLKTLLASGIPYLHAILDSTVRDCLQFKVHSNSSSVTLAEPILTKTSDQVGLTHSAITNNYHFYQHALLHPQYSKKNIIAINVRF